MNVIKWRSQEQEHSPTAILIRGPMSQYSKPPVFCGDNAPPNYMYAYMPRQKCRSTWATHPQKHTREKYTFYI